MSPQCSKEGRLKSGSALIPKLVYSFKAVVIAFFGQRVKCLKLAKAQQAQSPAMSKGLRIGAVSNCPTRN